MKIKPYTITSRGITMLELVIAVSLVAILASLAIPAYRNYVTEKDINQAKMDILEISQAIDKYYASENRLPEDLTFLSSEKRRDPWGNEYQFLDIQLVGSAGKGVRKDHKLKPINSDYDLYSKGADTETSANLSNTRSLDDIIRANNGNYIGLASEY